MLRLLIFPHQPCLRISVADDVPSDVFLTSLRANRNWFSGYSVSRGFFAVAPVRCAQFSPPDFLCAPPYPRLLGLFRKTTTFFASSCCLTASRCRAHVSRAARFCLCVSPLRAKRGKTSPQGRPRLIAAQRVLQRAVCSEFSLRSIRGHSTHRAQGSMKIVRRLAVMARCTLSI
jgi:hypothetical protein